ncbi:unnamed protein product [Meganyctiphanes norvegica]|uniref:Oplophorus-luciferin 2-monooxygenase non-catalytic subunit n=1 Tax=Meganyctiphanes norvegica TaxID=48144 RepID=A0AAV2QL61_MEGNR
MLGLQGFTLFVIFLAITYSHLSPSNNLQLPNQASVGNQGCPNSTTISPCTCTDHGSYGLSMDCSEVQSEERLKQIFQVQFPMNSFWTFSMVGNKDIKVLAEDIFGSATFEMFHITDGSLETVEDGALTGSKDTAKFMYFLDNKNLTKFPFQNIHEFRILDSFYILSSNISSTSGLSSGSLTQLGLDYNPLELPLPANLLDGLPELVRVSLAGVNLTQLTPGFISHNYHLEELRLEHNNINHLAADTFQSPSRSLRIISVANNHIQDVEHQAFPVVESLTIDLQHNALVYLNASIWRPLTEGHVMLRLGDNPLACDCDLAWLVLDPWNQKYTENGTCDGGVPISWLEPTPFESCWDTQQPIETTDIYLV